MSRLDETRQAKLDKRAALETAGVVTYPYSFGKKHWIRDCRGMMDQNVETAGRILSLRAHGKLIFLDLQDSTDHIQVMIKQDAVGEAVFQQFSSIDTGDFLAVTGLVTLSRTQEITIVADSCQFMGKALLPLPSEWNAAEDKEVRFRKRYLDMLVNPEVKKVLDARWLIIKEIRRFLQDSHDFIEVETPVLQPLYGGTNAKPFTTHMNALDCNFYLRLAPELYLKRLIVGGYERIFEIARNFRNEGIDQTHQPEFTMIEWYEAYADYHRMMDVAEGLVRHLVQKLSGGTSIRVGEHTADVGRPWPRITMKNALQQWAGIEFDTLSDTALQHKMAENQIEVIGDFTRGKALFALFDKLVTQYLIDPIWIIDYPRDVSPLAKKHRQNPELAERFEAYIGGKELADGWSEITDGVDQRAIFEGEQRRMRAGDTEAHPLDEDFLEAMEHGMPPLGGIGMGIDRLVMFLTNTWSIKEVIAFPTLRPLVSQTHSSTQPATSIEKTASPKPKDEKTDTTLLPSRAESEALLEAHVHNPALLHHCRMVAKAMEACAKELGEDAELWYQAGLLHDSDWEEFPDEHPTKALTEWLTSYPTELRSAIAAHAPERTGKQPETLIEKYLFACDELSGFMHAVSLMRPSGFDGMEVKSVKKKLKDKSFASNVSREDITQGFELIGKDADQHIAFLITVFS